jgi:hypothetical protein
MKALQPRLHHIVSTFENLLASGLALLKPTGVRHVGNHDYGE